MISWLSKHSPGKRLLILGILALIVLTAVAWFIEPENREHLRQAINRKRSQVQGDPVAPPAAVPKSSEAERIARMQRLVEASEKQLADARRRLEDPNSEYNRAREGFTQIDRQLAEKTREVQKLRQENKKAEADALEKTLEPLHKRRQQARDRFDLAIEERKTLQEKIATLPAKLERERKALEKLTGAGTSPATPESASPPTPPQPPPPVAGAPAGSGEQGKPAAAATAAAVKPAADAPPAAARAPTTPGTEEKGEPSKAVAAKLKDASEQAKKKEAEAKSVRERAEKISTYLDGLRGQIVLEQRLLTTAQKKAADARLRLTELKAERQGLVAAGKEDELGDVDRRIDEESRRQEEAESDIRESTERLAEMNESLGRVSNRRAEIQQEADQREYEAEKAQKKVAELQNPFTPRNVLQWFLDHGPRLLIILLGMLLLHRMVILSSRRIVNLMTGTKRAPQRIEEQDRAETLVGVFRNTSSLLILGGGVLMLLDEIGIPIVPLMGGAAVFGLAIAFGAQNLIKDYFSGFMVLMEDQYAVKDVIRIGSIEGQVERISLRITVVRDIAGVVHFVPHGTITTVSNFTHGWSRALFDIGIAYKEDPDRVMDLLMGLGRELRKDPRFAPLILEDPEMLGVDAFQDSAVVIKFFIKTRPLKQWPVKREMLRRIKRRFDELGIEIPFPHRTVYHRHENGAADKASDHYAA